VSSSKGFSLAFLVTNKEAADKYSDIVPSSLASFLDKLPMSGWTFTKTRSSLLLAAKSKQLGREQHAWDTVKPAFLRTVSTVFTLSLPQ
jgi:hypothetical protein